jgi:putative transposase
MTESHEFRVYPQRLHHDVPGWVKTGSYFHIRVRVTRDHSKPLTQQPIAKIILDAARNYHERGRWFGLIFLLMPDHVHALLAFPFEERMSRVIGEWKHYVAKTAGIDWQANYFDHRIRNASGLMQKHAYILRNPVIKGLCAREEDWPWVWRPPAGE